MLVLILEGSQSRLPAIFPSALLSSYSYPWLVVGTYTGRTTALVMLCAHDTACSIVSNGPYIRSPLEVCVEVIQPATHWPLAGSMITMLLSASRRLESEGVIVVSTYLTFLVVGVSV
jgi:hypothetical protein